MGRAYRADNDAGPFNAYYERPATIALLGEVRGRRVLEVGCGPGALTEWLAGMGAIVTAVDVSPEMVRIAGERVGGRATLLVADVAEPLRFAADGSQDLVVGSLVLHYVRDWAPVLAEFHRVLAPGGVVVLSTHHPALDWQLFTPEDYFAVEQVTEVWSVAGQAFEVTFWRRPLRAMTAAIDEADFVIDRLCEPEPLPELGKRDPVADRKLRTGPRFLFLRLRPR